MWPALAGIATGAAMLALGVRVWSSGICFALCGFVTGTLLQEFVRGAQVRRGATGTDIFTALVGLVGRSKRRYGGYIVHLGVVLIFLGFAGEGFKQEEQINLNPGQQVTVGRFTVRHDALRVTSDGQKQMITGHVSVFEAGEPIGTMQPAKWFFNKRENEPTTEVAIRRSPAEDLYIVLAGYDAAKQTATYAITINPLVNWIWFGFGVMAMGSIITLLPERAFAFAATKVPAAAATTTTLLILLLLPPAALAQTGRGVESEERIRLRKQLEGDIMCTCGGCRAPMNDCPMGPTCHGLQAQKAKLETFLARGMNRQQVRAAFVADFGSQDVLAAPMDEGFNRLAWLFPYMLGVTGALTAAFVAFRWSHRDPLTSDHDPSMASTENRELRARLDDELRDLD
jgi:cytochrome c-type biogenesis protein CcmF